MIDVQLGCAGPLIAMMALDQTITFTGVRITPPKPTPIPTEKPAPSVTNPAPGSIGAFIASILVALFKRK